MDQINYQPGPEFRKIIDATPLVSVDLLIENITGEILLGKRVNRPAMGYWFVPGGRIRKNETIDAAVIRISKTELGFPLNKSLGELVGCFEHIYEDNYWGDTEVNTHYVVLAFSFNVDGGTQIKGDEQHEAFRWWSVDELLASADVHENTKEYFKYR